MTLSCEKIREKIDENNKLIESILKPNQFTLNNIVADLLKENQKLQQQCAHKYEGGYCIYCDKEEPICGMKK